MFFVKTEEVMWLLQHFSFTIERKEHVMWYAQCSSVLEGALLVARAAAAAKKPACLSKLSAAPPHHRRLQLRWLIAPLAGGSFVSDNGRLTAALQWRARERGV